ncbi:MAG: hypothetical protein ACI936_003522, partial [Paraglaciecola sp.]
KKDKLRSYADVVIEQKPNEPNEPNKPNKSI